MAFLKKNENINNQANALRVQKNQINQADSKLTEIDSLLSQIQNEQNEDDLLLDKMLSDTDALLEQMSIGSDLDYSKELAELESELNTVQAKKISLIKELDTISISENTTWEEY